MASGKKKATQRKTTKKKTGTGTKGEPSFEQALERLENLVQRLEDGDVPLEESLRAYAEGTRLINLCMERLDRAETLIRELHESTKGFRLEASSLGDEAFEGEDDHDEDDPEEESAQDELGF